MNYVDFKDVESKQSPLACREVLDSAHLLVVIRMCWTTDMYLVLSQNLSQHVMQTKYLDTCML